jgi:alkylation response protein AidB-like acyl-CoA dehydrogenase
VDFAFNEDQELLRETTRRFLESNQSVTQLRQVLESDETTDRKVWAAGCELGWAAMLVPVDYDGGSVTDQPLVDLEGLAEELGRQLNPAPFIPTNVVADALARSANSGLKDRYLRAIASGEIIAAFCLASDGTTDLANVGVTATAAGEGWSLAGTAGFVHGAAVADIALVAAKGPSGLLFAVVPLSAAGIELRSLTGLDVTRRFAEVSFEGVTVPGEAVLATGAEAESLAQRALAVATVLKAAEAVGAVEHIVAMTVQYAKDRTQFGRPIGSFQALKHRMSDLHVVTEAVRAAARYAALALNDGSADAAEAVAAAGSYVPDAYATACGECLQLHGGIGFTWEHDIHLYMRRAKVDQVLYGDPPSHREALTALIEARTPHVEN